MFESKVWLQDIGAAADCVRCMRMVGQLAGWDTLGSWCWSGSIGWCPGCTTREQLNQTRYIQYADGKEKEEEEDRFEEVSYSRIKKGERE